MFSPAKIILQLLNGVSTSNMEYFPFYTLFQNPLAKAKFVMTSYEPVGCGMNIIKRYKISPNSNISIVFNFSKIYPEIFFK